MQWYKAAEQFVEALASADPVPGGGAAAAMTATMGCALAMMAAQTTINRKSTSQEVKTRLTANVKKLACLKEELKSYIQLDGDAYTGYLTAKKLSKDNPDRATAIQSALLFAARVPADTAATACHCLREIDALKSDIAPIILSDVYCGQDLLKCAVKCCVENIKANLEFITHPDQTQKLQQQINSFLKSC